MATFFSYGDVHPSTYGRTESRNCSAIYGPAVAVAIEELKVNFLLIENFI
jgi:hypothetical protein